MNRLHLVRSLFYLFGIMLVAIVSGCSEVAETDRPLTADEQHELDDQLSTLEQESTGKN